MRCVSSPCTECLWIEAIYRDGHRQLDAVVATSRYGKMDGGWDLRRDAVIRECADQADGRIRCARCYHCEVGVLSFADFGQTIETAAELDDSTAFTESVERIGMHAERDQIAGAERAALIAEDLECGVDISALHGG